MNPTDMHWKLADITAQYGENGTQSLEYIGLVFGESVLQQIKVYHTVKEVSEMSEEWQKILWEQWFEKLSTRYPVKICDVSKSGTDSSPTYRMMILFTKPLDAEQTNTLIKQEFAKIPVSSRERFQQYAKKTDAVMKMPHSSLMQIGIELDADLQYQSLKYYLSVNPSRLQDLTVTKSLTELFCSMQNISYTDSIEQLLMQVQQCWYSPAFIGINDTSNQVEAKLYYVSNLFGRSLVTDTPTQTKQICDALKIEKEFCQVLQSLLQKERLYPKGIALSFGNIPLVRMYLKQISSRYFKNVV